MGKTISDFKQGRAELYRDRIRIEDLDTEIGTAWQTTRPKSGTRYGAGSLSRCVDQNHPSFYSFLRARNSGRHGQHIRNLDVGGPFAKEATTLTMPTIVDAWDRSGGIPNGYYGVYFPSVYYVSAMQQAALKSPVFPAIPSDLGIDRNDLRVLGSTAIKKSIPDIPQFSLFRFVGELRAGLPKVPLKVLAKERKLRNVGGEYLNVQFGIMPLISDLQKFIEQLQNPALRSAVKRSLNEEHRVRKVLDKGSTYSKRSQTSTELNTVQHLTNAAGTLEFKTDFRIWSSCSFVYLQVSELDRLLGELDDKLGGMGAVPSAIDVWNLTAWSWLVDWFTNFNHVITNLSYLGRDGLYMQRGYLMATYSKSTVHYQTGLIKGKRYSTIGHETQVRKYRIAASPFGFGYTWKDFDPFQLSILGALGVNRLRF